jgi:IS30 family transposase
MLARAVFGSGNSQIATLLERQTRYVMLVKVAGKDTQTVVAALVRDARKLPRALQVTHLGSRQGTGSSQALHSGHGHPGVLL